VCDPVSMLVGAVGATVVGRAIAPKQQSAAAPAQPDPAEERAKAEAEAAQRANAQLAMDQRRRREQGSLLAKGGMVQPSFPMGDEGSGSSPLSTSGRLASRTTTARAASLISRGASGGGGGFGGGTGGGRTTAGMSLQ
jgi:hypothetical protein